jgi:hypothetical protein
MTSEYLLVTVLTILIITIIMASYELLPQNAIAASPSFPRQEVLGHSANWFDMYNNRPITDGASYGHIDINSVNYFSDGRTLNATMWLADFQPIPPPDHDNVNYGMYFDSDFNKNTGVKAIDYKVEISWDKKNQTWTRVFEEWGTNITKPKTLSKPEPAINFYENGSSYVTLSADLDAIVSPEKYRVIFYAEVIDSIERSTWIVDATNWVSIPPPEFIVSVLPSSLDLRQGHDSTVEVRVNSTIDSGLKVKLSPQELSLVEDDQKDFDLKFELEELHISPYGIAASPLHINAFDHTDVSPHTIVIWANSTIPEESLFFSQNESDQKSDNNIINSNEEDIDSVLPSYVTDETNEKQSTFLVQVDKWDLNDQFKAAIDQWFTPLTAVYSTITGIISGILGWIYGRRRKKDVDNNNNSNNKNNNRTRL